METKNTHLRRIAIVGNPNCGKTTLFNALTGSNQKVGNWPGVTVEKKSGTYRHAGDAIEITDLPGIYSITPAEHSGEDERIARDHLLTGEAEAVLNIVDASNLERNLYLTTQLIEMRVPMLVVVNMIDIADEHRLAVDLRKLEEKLGCPVVGVVASREDGLEVLKDAVSAFLRNPSAPPMRIVYSEPLREGLGTVTERLRDAGLASPERLAAQLLEGAPGLEARLPGIDLAPAREAAEALNARLEGNIDIELANARYGFVADVTSAAVTRIGEVSETLTEKIDLIVLNRWLGIPIFLFVMYVMFLFTQNLGGAFIDFFDILVGGLLVDGFGGWLRSVGSPEWLTTILASGLGGGLQTVATFIPVIFFLFLFIAVLEDSGYMARAAFIMDRFMRTLGLPGKAFVPLIVGFGCSVPAIMAARTMDRESDRIMTVLMAPFMSCGARLPVYVLFAAAFFPTNGQNLVFGLYLIGILAAILTGFLLKRTALPGSAAPFVMEIPPYHVPTLKGVLLRTWERLRNFVMRAGKVIVVIVAGIGFLNSIGTDGTFGNEDSEKSVLSAVGRAIVPVLEPMGVAEENWPAAVGIFTGIFAKESVVGTLNSLYATTNAGSASPEGAPEAGEAGESDWSFGAVLSEASGSVVANLSDLGGALLDPFGIAVGDLSDEAAAAEAQEIETGTIGAIRTLFGTTSAAFAYLLLVLLYLPCCAAIAAIYRELGRTWTVFACAWTTTLGYSAATIFYRTVNFSADPGYATVAIGGCLAALVGMYFYMKALAKRDAKKGPRVIPIVALNRRGGCCG